MADEEKNETIEGGAATDDTPAEEPVSAPEGPIAPAAEVDETPAAEAETTMPVAEAEPAGDAPSEPEPAPAEEASGDEPAEPEPVAEAQAAAAPKPEAPAPAAPEPKRKKKRLPRALRPQRSKPRREQPSARRPIVRLPKPEAERGRRQERRGVVVSSTSDKTIVVKVDTVKAHPRYKKVVRRSRKFHAHDEANRAKVGDVVRIVETRPLSKLKNWRLAEIVEEAK
jgi:small subunit ribosomal protein S17